MRRKKSCDIELTKFKSKVTLCDDLPMINESNIHEQSISEISNSMSLQEITNGKKAKLLEELT